MSSTVVARGIRKAFGTHVALRGIDLDVGAGSVLALLGPNGAGKTTTVRILATLTVPDRGWASVAGFDVVRHRHQVRRCISVVGQQASLDDLLSGQENLDLLGRLRGLDRRGVRKRRDELLDRFDLTDAAGRRVATYSGGMRRRLDLAAGLIGNPQVMLLDEPTTGLDPRSRQALWCVVADLARCGVAIVLTTQYLEEADYLADRVALIDQGRLVADGSPAELKAGFGGRRLDIEAVDDDAFDAVSRVLGPRVTVRDRNRRHLELSTTGEANDVRAVLDLADPGQDRIRRFSQHATTLDEVFLALTGQHATKAPTTEETVDA